MRVVPYALYSVILSDEPVKTTMLIRLIRRTIALGAAGAAGAATAHYLTDAARGTTSGAPGYTKALSTLGRSVDGSMREGVIIVGTVAALSGVATYQMLAPGAPSASSSSDSPEDAAEEDATEEIEPANEA